MRVANKNKYSSSHLKVGEPTLLELRENTPVMRKTSKGIAQFIKHNGQLYSSFFLLHSRNKVNPFFREDRSNGSVVMPNNFKISWGEVISKSNTLETFSFFDNFKVSCFGVFINVQTEDDRDPIYVSHFTKDNFKIHRATGFGSTEEVTINYLAIGK